jgi:hypothetical protein
MVNKYKSIILFILSKIYKFSNNFPLILYINKNYGKENHI